MFDFAFAGSLALRTVSRSGAIEALASVSGSFTGAALTRTAAYAALLSMFIHAPAPACNRPFLHRRTPFLLRYRQVEMPIYEYHCRQCANEFELLVLRGSPEAACPACQSQDIEQLLSGFAVSSEGISQARLKAARRKLANSSRVKDQKVAEAEYMKKEREEHGGG
jgi:putative FmdB family regulatory protein